MISKWDVPSAKVAAFEAEWAKLVGGASPPTGEGFVAGAHGWGTEEVGGNKHFFVVTGWESVAKAEANKASSAEKGKALIDLASYDLRYINLEKVK